MKRGLRWKVLIPLILVGLVVGLAGSWFVNNTYQRQLDEHMQRRGESIARALDTIIRSTVFAQISPADKVQTLETVVADLGELPDVTLIVVVSGDPPRVVATTHQAWRDVAMDQLPYERVQEDLFDAIETRRMHLHFHWDTLEYDVSWPLALQIEDRPHGEPSDGAIMLHLDAQPVRAQLRVAAGETIAALIGAIVAISALTWFVLNRFVLARLASIEHAMSQRAGGDSQAYAPALGEDEIGRLSSRFNAMLAELDNTDAELRRARDHLEEQVDDRTRELKESHARLREADRLATVGTFAAGVAHDLNNLLLPIRSGLHVLDRTHTNGSREHLDEMRQAVRFLQQLAASMRLCALDPADGEATQGECDIGEWWAEVSALLTRAFLSRTDGAGSLTSRVEPDLPRIGIATHHLTQAVLNLLVNAGDACAEQPDPRAALDAGTSGRRGFIRITVSDNGSGMAPEIAERAFDPFFTTKKRGASSGLGLAMVRSITEAVGGSVTVESRAGSGTAISLDLPALRRDSSTPAAAERLRVAISVEDSRLRAHLIGILRHHAHVAETDSIEPPDADVWIVDASRVASAGVSRYSQANPRGRVVLLGEREQNEGLPSSICVALPVSFTEEELLSVIAGSSSDTSE